MGIFNNIVNNGAIAGQGYSDRADLIQEKKRTQGAHDETFKEKQVNGQLANRLNMQKQTLDKALEENEEYKKLLAKPLQEILKENSDYKKAYNQQQEMITKWMMSQTLFKNTAFILGKKLGMSQKEIEDLTWDNGVESFEKIINQDKENIIKQDAENNDVLLISETTLDRFQQSKDTLIKAILSNSNKK